MRVRIKYNNMPHTHKWWRMGTLYIHIMDSIIMPIYGHNVSKQKLCLDIHNNNIIIILSVFNIYFHCVSCAVQFSLCNTYLFSEHRIIL